MMNELDLFRNPITEEKTVTTKELAEILNVTPRTIQETVKRLNLANVLSQVKINGKLGYVYNERQATLIKQEIQKHHNLQTRQIDNVTTAQEENETVMKAMQILVQRKVKLEKELQEAKEQILLDAPKVEAWETFLNKDGLVNFQNASRCLRLSQVNGVRKYLMANGYLFVDKSNNTCPNKAKNHNYFEVKPYTAESRSGVQTLITRKGLEWLAYKKEEIEKYLEDNICD